MVLIFLANLRPEVSDSVTLHLPVEASDGPFEATATVVRVEEVSEEHFFWYLPLKFEKNP